MRKWIVEFIHLFTPNCDWSEKKKKKNRRAYAYYCTMAWCAAKSFHIPTSDIISRRRTLTPSASAAVPMWQRPSFLNNPSVSDRQMSFKCLAIPKCSPGIQLRPHFSLFLLALVHLTKFNFSKQNRSSHVSIHDVFDRFFILFFFIF